METWTPTLAVGLPNFQTKNLAKLHSRTPTF